jgi:hypothetical protein
MALDLTGVCVRPQGVGGSSSVAMGMLMNEPAKLLLLASLLAQDRIITNNGKAFLKGEHLRAGGKATTSGHRRLIR